MKTFAWLYFSSLALGLAWFLWVFLALVGVKIGQMSPLPIVISAIGVVSSKLLARHLLGKENLDG